jgi:thiamine biosynthesis lipoprotein
MTRRVEEVMGTAVSLDLRDQDVPAQAVDAVFDHLREVDARFSTYRAGSEISRLARGELEPSAASPDVRHVLAVCEQLRRDSGGAFDASRAGRDGRLDPSGYVKGWAVEEAAWRLDDVGARDFLINAGGDVVARGEAAPGQRWRVGIRHPDQPDKVAAVLAVGDGAVATSGTYERGDHILDPRTGRPARGLRSLTVVGPRLGFVDAYATAAFVMGMDGLRWVATHPDHEALAITDDDRLVWTEGLARYLVSGTGVAAGLG